MKKTNKQAQNLYKQSIIVKSYIDGDINKKFKKKVEEHGMTKSQWVRHQIMKWVK